MDINELLFAQLQAYAEVVEYFVYKRANKTKHIFPIWTYEKLV